ncbi:MAG: hypothetical protein E7214_11560 [Clostridium sp.]|nr:hypothetical protein [Clostridium sp.]
MKNTELHLIGKNKFEIRENEKNFEVSDKEVLIKVKACGVCGTDLTYAKVSNHDVNNSIVLGHEFVGVIEKAGKEVKNVSVGDKVVVDASVTCGKCEHCIKGEQNFCSNTKSYGYPPYDGGYQERIVFPADFCYKLNEKTDMVSAVMVEPLAVCLHAFNLSKFKLGMDVAILGAGPIGLSLIKLLRMSGANKIFVAEPVKERIEIAKELGADFVVNPYEEDFMEVVSKNTQGQGVDRVFEASGNDDSMAMTTKVAKSGAELVMIGIPKGNEFNISHPEARKKGVTIKMVRRLNHTIPLALKMIEDGFDVSKIVTHEFALKDMVEAFGLIQSYQDGIIKAAVTME